MGLKTLLMGLMDKFLVKYGYADPSTNMNVYLRQKTNQTVQFCLSVLLSGAIIHGALIFVYFFKKVSIPWFIHLPLVISYGLASYTGLNWIHKIKGGRLK